MIIDLPEDVQEVLFSYCSADDVRNLSCVSRHYNEALRQILFSSTCINVSTLKVNSSAEKNKLARRLEVLQHAQHLRLESSSCKTEVLDKGVCATLNRSILGLEELSIFGKDMKITDDHIKILCLGLQELKKLCLQNCNLLTNVTTQSIKLLVSLEELTFTSTQITYGVRSISELPLLRKLNLGYSKDLDDKSLQYIFKLKRLQSLTLCHCPRITFNVQSDLEELNPSLTDLEELILFGCSIAVPEGVKTIAGFKKLKKLDLSNCRDMSNEGVACLVGLTQLTELGLSFCRDLTKDCFPYLKKFKELWKLSIHSPLVRTARKELGIEIVLP